ncbi:uncharacterized protein V1518DRAFT_411198 [Limtongia smithiae]|uniref:uncharacterized protein n=1 Tax=Limtongia smithiae TaxID=1125753 RepID=UPI0034CDC425
MLRLDGKVAIIVGLGQSQPGGWGIGAAIAVLLARQGAVIFGGNRTVASAAETKATIEKEGGICDVLATDATSSESMEKLVNSCMDKYGKIDILVNNVGRSEPGDPATMDETTWDAQVDINLKSVYLACHLVLPIMARQETGGAVVNISSVAGLRYIGKPQVAYSATKAAVIQFTKATAIVYAEKKVRLNTVVPGLMHTPYTDMMAQRYGNGRSLEDFLEMRNKQVPMGKMGDAWDVANAVLFLASSEAKYITGQKIVVDGGITSSTGKA